jgi:hypothetical protein
VTLSAPTAPTGAVRVLEGRTRLAAGTLKASHGGKLSLRLPKLSKGKHRLTVKYAGSSTVDKATRTFTVTSR